MRRSVPHSAMTMKMPTTSCARCGTPMTATFTGSTAHVPASGNGEVVEHEEPAAMSASFSETGTGLRQCSAKTVESAVNHGHHLPRDVVLAHEGQIDDMPMRPD